jgi:hypothetical protein
MKMGIVEMDIIAMLEKKGSKIRYEAPHIGEFVFDYNGDLIGHYAGEHSIALYSDLNNDNKEFTHNEEEYKRESEQIEQK